MNSMDQEDVTGDESTNTVMDKNTNEGTVHGKGTETREQAPLFRFVWLPG